MNVIAHHNKAQLYYLHKGTSVLLFKSAIVLFYVKDEDNEI